MAFKITPSSFKLGTSVAANQRPALPVNAAARQAVWRESVNFRRDPNKAWLTQTDLYQLVMANQFHQICGGETPIAHFELFVRKLPAGQDFMIFSGLHEILRWLSGAKMDQQRIDYLLEQPILKESNSDLASFRKYLEDFQFKLDVWANPEGSFYSPMTPCLGISGPIEQVLLAETYLLSVFNSLSAISTRSANYRLANPGMKCVEMGMRRHHPLFHEDVAFEAWKQGFVGTSNVEAGYQYDIPIIGTNSHAMYLAFDSEIEAISAWMKVYPNYPMVLTDTFHTLINALKTEQVLKEHGLSSLSYRVDNSQLIELMDIYKRMMDGFGFETGLRVGSSDLTPEVLAQMQEQHCVANAAGIGTKLVHTNPFGAVYKLSQIDGPNGARFACKFSSKGKVGNLPGSHQIWRAYDADGHAIRDTVALLDEEIPGATPIMRPYMREGMLLAPYLSKEQLRAQFEEGRKGLPASSPYPVLLSERAEQLRAEVIEGIREREITPFLPQLAQYFTRAELEGVLPEDEIDIIFGGE